MNSNPEITTPFCQIKQVLRRLQKLEALLKKSHNLSLDEGIVLCCLSQRCNCQGNIAGETGLTPTQASRVLARLEEKQLIERSIGQADKRQMVFSLSEQGQALLREATPLAQQFFKQ
ncbi:MAG: MarR family transcriptional regulator [Bacteroidales bacterium]